MTADQPRITFEPVGFEHMPLLQGWLDGPHWRQWWGEPEVELGYIRDMVEGRDTTRPFIFHVDGQPAGYIQYWFLGHWQNEPWIKDSPWLLALPKEAIGVDLSIGDASLLAQGIGSTVLRIFTEQLVEEGYRFIVIDPAPNNLRAVRAYEKAGYRVMPELADMASDALIMKFEPDGTEIFR